ncbi:MAG: hypothetical protein BM557_00150 [Flavobacterium sp. MedPE-SWcel]|uniref:TlpA family protein disulfide reductase n=1 Tax=uncultured Flavobacterium sp. TaxID=165435 RepID=UPI000919BFE8|nr:TlpA disulfide reductase family protein [uncultured Flavobacterium sp.]OIQ22435.1 MAG: hypothetical protein BM557_00150 [Flavobacterium sp. MedPE-SWcel]
MKKMLLLPLLLITFVSCTGQKEDPTSFTEAALNDKMTSLSGEEMQLKDVLEKYKGKTVLVDVWASWCPDCIKGMPKVEALQEKYPDVVYLFLSYDKSVSAWEKGIEKYNVNGEHYLVGSKWKGGTFSESIGLDWIPRYLVLDKEGNIAMYYAKEADDEKIIAQLKK